MPNDITERIKALPHGTISWRIEKRIYDATELVASGEWRVEDLQSLVTALAAANHRVEEYEKMLADAKNITFSDFQILLVNVNANVGNLRRYLNGEETLPRVDKWHWSKVGVGMNGPFDTALEAFESITKGNAEETDGKG